MLRAIRHKITISFSKFLRSENNKKRLIYRRVVTKFLGLFSKWCFCRILIDSHAKMFSLIDRERPRLSINLIVINSILEDYPNKIWHQVSPKIKLCALLKFLEPCLFGTKMFYSNYQLFLMYYAEHNFGAEHIVPVLNGAVCAGETIFT